MSVNSVSEITTDSTPVPPRFSSGGKIRAILALGAVVGIGSVLTLAAWTDEGIAQATFSTGSIDIKLNGDDGVAPGYAFADLSMSGMKDGSVKYGLLPVTNDGTLPFTYTMGTTITGDSGLAGALRISVKSVAAASCTETTYNAGTSIATPVAVDTGFVISTPRSMPVSVTPDYLCFKIELPSGSANSVQNKTVTASLTFTATQLP
ncbi:hypothetical protein BH10ACT7_BH10ACT7_20580 [soil metagenome]